MYVITVSVCYRSLYHHSYPMKSSFYKAGINLLNTIEEGMIVHHSHPIHIPFISHSNVKKYPLIHMKSPTITHLNPLIFRQVAGWVAASPASPVTGSVSPSAAPAASAAAARDPRRFASGRSRRGRRRFCRSPPGDIRWC